MPVLLEAPSPTPVADPADPVVDPATGIGGCVRTDAPAPPSVEADLAHLTELLADHDIEGARAWSQELLRRWPDHPRAQHWAYVLAPTVARVVPRKYPPRRRDLEREWLKQHGHEYAGLWVVLYEDRLLAADPERAKAVELARQVPCDGEPFLHHVGPIPKG